MSRMNTTAGTNQSGPVRTTVISALALFPFAAVSVLMMMQILGYWTY